MIDYKVYINGNLLDMFEDETVKITDSIKDAKDVGAIFTEYSKQLTVPASKRNNSIFKNFYNYDILNGFDARVKQPAEIKLNGETWKKGFIELMGVQMELEQPKHYKIVFRGELSKLKDIIGDDKLSQLTGLDQYNHRYNFDNVSTGFRTFCEVVNEDLNINAQNQNESICYPLISHTKRYVYDTDNLYNITFDSDGNEVKTALEFEQLKPAIRLIRIIEAIEQRYDISFRDDNDDDFFTTDLFRSLYMLLHNDSGEMIAGDVQKEIFLRTDFTLDSGNSSSDLFDEVEGIFIPDFNQASNTFLFEVDLIVGGTGLVNYRIYDQFSGEVYREEEDVQVTNGDTISEGLTDADIPAGIQYVYPIIEFETQSLGITTLDVDVFVQIFEASTNTAEQSNYDLTGGAINTTENVIIRDQIPSMKVIDFLTSIFKQFNLVSYVDDNSEIVVQTLDKFYENGNEYDLTDYIDIKKKNIDKLNPFSDINFEFKDASSFVAITRNRKLDDKYGNLSFSLAENSPLQDQFFAGGKYDIKVGFEKIIQERLIDINDQQLTPYTFGWLVDKKQDPTLTEPYVFTPIVTQSDNDKTISFESSGGIETLYVRASNIFSLQQSLNFGTEIDEHLQFHVNNSLFNNFYRNYVERVYNPQSRKVSLEAVLPMWFIRQYELNDEIIINGRRFRINKIDIKLNNRRAKMELINIPQQPLPTQTDSESVNLTPLGRPQIQSENITSSSIKISWTPAHEFDERIDSYDVFTRNGTFETNVLKTDPLEFELTNLPSNLTLDFEVISRFNAEKSGIRVGENKREYTTL